MNLNEKTQQKLSRYEEHLKDQFRDPGYLSNFTDDDPGEIIDTAAGDLLMGEER